MCIPQVTLQFYFVLFFSFGRQQKSEFEDADRIIGIDPRWTISNIMSFSVFLVWNVTDLILSDYMSVALLIT